MNTLYGQGKMSLYCIKLNPKNKKLEIFEDGALCYISGIFDDESYYIFNIKNQGVIKKEKIVGGMHSVGPNGFSISIGGNWLGNTVLIEFNEQNKYPKKLVFKTNFFQSNIFHRVWLCIDTNINLNVQFNLFTVKEISLKYELHENSQTIDSLDLFSAVILIFFWLKYDSSFDFKYVDNKTFKYQYP